MSERICTYETGLAPRICVIGVGGAGGNAVANMIESGVAGVEFIVANTDAQALNASPVEGGIQLGRKVTQGLGAGAAPEIGRAAALESIEEIAAAIDGAHMCFIAAGMGGGTGTGAAPVIAAAARAKGILTVGVVTKPFGFEGRRRSLAADRGIEALRPHVDTLIVIPNQNLFRVVSPSTTFRQAFRMADEVLEQGVRSVTDLIVTPGLINLDFADIRTVMRAMGKAMLGTGEATGDNRASVAAERAIQHPLLDGAITGARGLIISITGGEDMRLMEIDEAAMRIKEEVDPDANIIWGSAVDPRLEGRIRVSIVATGIDVDPAPSAAASGLVAASPASPGLASAFSPPLAATAEGGMRADDEAFEVRIAAPWEDGYAATDTIVLTNTAVAAEMAPPLEARAADAAISFVRGAQPAEEDLILVRAVQPVYSPGSPTHSRDPFGTAVSASQSRPSLLQRLSTLASGGSGRGHSARH